MKAPWFDFTIGDKSLNELGIRYLVKSITFEEEIGKFCSIKMVLKSGSELGSAYYLLKHGGVFQLSMGYYNESIKRMGLAFHVGIQPDFAQQTVTITFADYLRAMSIGEKDRVLVGKTLEQVVRAVIADYTPLVVGIIDNGDITISETISQSKRTDFQLLQEMAKSFAMVWRLDPTETSGIWSISLRKINFDDDSSQYESMYTYPNKENQELTQNIHLKNFKPKSNILGDIPSKVTIESNNPNQPMNVDSKLYDEGQYVSEIRGSEVVFTVFGQVNRIQFHENVTDEEAAQIIADQMLQDEEIKFVQAKDVQLSEGNAGVRIGQRRHIVPKGIPMFSKVFEGDYLVTRTKHQIDAESGYDTWIDVGRESLTVPPPPEIGLSGGGGPPVVIWVERNDVVQGWYVSFSEIGEIIYGGSISRSVILANDYWMRQVNSATGLNVITEFYASPISEGYPGVGSSYTNVSDTGFSTINTMSASSPGNLQGIAVYIDFPEQYSESPLADSVTDPSTIDPYESEPETGRTTTYGFAEGSLLARIDAFRAEQEFKAIAASLYESSE